MKDDSAVVAMIKRKLLWSFVTSGSNDDERYDDICFISRHRQISVMTTCSASADSTYSATSTCSGGVYIVMSCGAYDSLWDSVKPMTRDYIINYFQYQEDVECVCMLNDWTRSNDEICADN